MQRFKNILVSIDLMRDGHSLSNELTPPSQEAVERAIWLAKLNSAHLRFFHAVDIPFGMKWMAEMSDSMKSSILDRAREALRKQFVRAVAEGVGALFQVSYGKSWLEITRQALRHDHDLVVAGTRHRGAIQSCLMGSTGIKLLRKCPCPVWITQPQPTRSIQSILVAHDLSPVGDLAMELGCSMAQRCRAGLNIVHSLELPELDSPFPSRISAARAAEFRSRRQHHIDTQLANYVLEESPQVHIISGSPSHGIMSLIDRHAVDLLVMGTIARSRIAGFIVGNTAEHLLPQIPCSVLAVKPSDFISPVSL